MGRTLLILITALIAACAPVDPREEEALRDFIVIGELEEADKVRTGKNDRWSAINDKFIIYEARRDDFLIEFRRRCHELTSGGISFVDQRTGELTQQADVRWDHNNIRPGIDTIRGCRIHQIYALAEGQKLELEELVATLNRGN